MGEVGEGLGLFLDFGEFNLGGRLESLDALAGLRAFGVWLGIRLTTVSTIGTIIPCAPASNARLTIQFSAPGMRTMGEEPAAATAATLWYMAASSMLPCSLSISTQSTPGSEATVRAKL